MTRKSICVYCGSRPGAQPAYAADAETLGCGIARAGMRLVYGAGDVGLMGIVARAAQAEGGDTFGVIPQHLVDWEVGKVDLQTYVVTETMHERKKVMFMNCDAVAVLPGGAGSLDELFEVLTWRQLGLHDKPILLINTQGYWDPLLAMLNQIVGERFAEASLINFIDVAENAGAALDRLAAHFAAS